MDNIKIKEVKDRVTIKKGWIPKKYIILYFIGTIIIFMIFISSDLLNENFKKIAIYFIRFSIVFIYWLYLNKDIRNNFIVESIIADFKNKEIILKTHIEKKVLLFKEIKEIKIYNRKNTKQNIKEKYT